MSLSLYNPYADTDAKATEQAEAATAGPLSILTRSGTLDLGPTGTAGRQPKDLAGQVLSCGSKGRRRRRAQVSHNGVPTTTLLFVLAEQRELRTDGNTTRSVFVDVPGLARLGPWIDRMRVHWESEDCTANFQAKVTLVWSVSGKTWSSPADVIAWQAGNQHVVGAEFTDKGKLGLNLQVALACANITGTAVEAGRATAVLEVTLKT